MTIDAANPIASYLVAGSGPYSVPWPYEGGDLAVWADKDGTITALSEGAHWTIAPASGPSGAVTLTAGAVTGFTGARLLIERVTQLEQGFSGVTGPERGIEASLDRLTRAVQDVRARTASGLRFLSSTALTPTAPLADGQTVMWQGGAMVPGPSAAQIEGAAGYAASAVAAANMAANILTQVSGIADALTNKGAVTVSATGDGVRDYLEVAGTVWTKANVLAVVVGNVPQGPSRWDIEHTGSHSRIVFGEPIPAGLSAWAVLLKQGEIDMVAEAQIGDLSTRSVADRAAAVAWAADNVPVPGMVLQWGGTGVRFVSYAVDVIPGLPGWVPNGPIATTQFGAAVDYSDAAGGSGTDDLPAINAAMAYGAAQRERVFVTGASLVSGPVVYPDNFPGFVGRKPVNTSTDQVGAPAWPAGLPTGSAFVGSHIAGPVVWIRYSDQWLLNVEIGATQARYDAGITTGHGNSNCGLLIEPPDTESAIMSRSGSIDCLVRNQPGDGVYACGKIATLHLIRPTQINVRRHGMHMDNGAAAGRVNKYRPGIVELSYSRSINCGGHTTKVGDPAEGVNQVFRLIATQIEDFRGGNDPSQLLVSSAGYILAEQLELVACAFAATSGYSGEVATLSHAYAIGGKTIALRSCRAVNYLAEPILLLASPWAGTGRDMATLSIDGLHSANGAAPDPVFMIKHDGHVYDLRSDNTSGNWSGHILDLATFAGSAMIDFDGELRYHNKRFLPDDLAVQGYFSIGNGFDTASEVTIADGAVTVTASSHRVDTEGDAAIDTLHTINSDAPSGTLLLLRLATSARQIWLENGTGNIRLRGRNRLLATSFDYVLLLRRTSTWDVVVFSDNTGAIYGTSIDVSGNAAIGGDLAVSGVATVKAMRSMAVTLADDTATSIEFSGTYGYGVLVIAGGTASRGAAMVHFRVGTSAFAAVLPSSTVVTAAAGALTGTTGTDGKLNISGHTDGRLYIENRTGASTTYSVTFLSMDHANGLPL